MPTYVTLETIQEVMQEKKCITWRVIDEDENQLHYYSPATTTQWRDSFNTLEKFLNGINGTNYVIIRVYSPEYKQGKGGDTATTIFTYYYRLKGAAKSTPDGQTSATGIDANYLAIMNQMHQMRLDFMQERHSQEIERLKEKVKESNSEEKDYFSKVAKVIGKEFGKEWLKAEGYQIDEEGVPIQKAISGTTDPAKKPEPAKVQEVQTIFKRTGDATVRIMKVSKALGSDYEAVAASFEDIATLAETNPLKLKQIFDNLKEGSE